MSINTISNQQLPASFAVETQRLRREMPATEAFRQQLTSMTDSPKIGNQGMKDEEIISQAEREYFASLFPTAADQLKTYNVYQRSGVHQSGQLGTVVDKKG